MFLRNHDELDLGRLTEEQRQKVFDAFGPEPDMQLYNRGIRRFIDPGSEVPLHANRAGVPSRRRPAPSALRHTGRRAVLARRRTVQLRCHFSSSMAFEDPALDALALIVRGADTARPDSAPQSPGSAGAIARPVGQFRGRPRDARSMAWSIYDAALHLVPVAAGRDPQLDAAGMRRGEARMMAAAPEKPDGLPQRRLDPRDRPLFPAARHARLRRAGRARRADGEGAGSGKALARRGRDARRHRRQPVVAGTAGDPGRDLHRLYARRLLGGVGRRLGLHPAEFHHGRRARRALRAFRRAALDDGDLLRRQPRR